ncbi:MAG: hypothetical protein ACRELU_10335 [Gemmatimonadota bacterium]
MSWVVFQRLTLVAATSIELEDASDAEVNEETRRKSSSFAECGYRKLAVYRGRFHETAFSIVVMSGPDGTSWAEVTDQVWETASAFGPRLVRTATNSMMPPGSTPVQCVPSGSPETIVAEHRRLLASLERRGLQPDRLDVDEILRRFEFETRATQAMLRQSMWRTATDLAWRRPLRLHHGRPVLGEDPRAGARIDAWLAVR